MERDEARSSSSSEPEGAAAAARPPIHNPPLSVSPVHGKRPAAVLAGPPPPPLKRRRGDFNAAYLNLLNRDIHNASSGLVHEDDGHDDESPRPLRGAQVGAVAWTAAEQAALFAAAGRLGRANVAGIAARVRTKSEPEVRQYLTLLDERSSRRPGEGEDEDEEGRSKGGPIAATAAAAALRPADVPAAVEVGAECAAALEAAADALALRQEGYEEEVERARWGPRWLVTAALARTLDNREEEPTEPGRRRRRRSASRGERDEGDTAEEEKEERGERANPDDLPPSSLQLFAIENWLRLAERVFMNSAVPDGNWRAVSEAHEPPAMRLTALVDLYGLARSVTRRLLLAALYAAESRTRTRGLDGRGRRRCLRVEDVEVAVASLGMRRSSGEFWARCARRLRLDVVDDGSGESDLSDEGDQETGTDTDEEMDGDDQTQSTAMSDAAGIEDAEQESEDIEEDDYHEVMNYDEVEAALGFPVANATRSRTSTPEAHMSDTSEYTSSVSEAEIDDEDDDDYKEQSPEEEGEGEDSSGDIEMEAGQDTPGHESDDGVNQGPMAADIEEAMLSLAPTEYDTASVRRAIRSRIRAEHRLEQDAERLDSRASAAAETALWAVLHDDGDARSHGRKRSGGIE
ncbi:hypothetical protein F4802DRAFT_613734 [Xylaria palmicola]|nr:hypothetical protein F4802DRAFT_613734 [Xylaria palmicola]